MRPERWRTVWEQMDTARHRRPGAESLKNRFDIDEAICLLDRLVEVISTSLRFGGSSYFEPLIHSLDRAASLLNAANDDLSDVDDVDVLFVGMHEQAARRMRADYGTSDPDGWFHLPSLAREVVLSIVREAWDGSQHQVHEALPEYRAFFDRLAADHEHVGVYSLNYDPLVRTALHGSAFVTGFEDEGRFDARAYCASRCTLAFLHGHVDFATDTKGEIVLAEDAGAAWMLRLRRLEREPPPFTVGQQGVHHNRTMTTGMDKAPSFSLQPYAAYLRSLYRDVEQASQITVLGTSLADEHLAALLRDTHSFENKAVMFVDFISLECRRRMKQTQSTGNRYVPLLALLGTTLPSMRLPWDEIADTGRTSFGRGLTYYAKGTRAFLHDPASWTAPAV